MFMLKYAEIWLKNCGKTKLQKDENNVKQNIKTSIP